MSTLLQRSAEGIRRAKRFALHDIWQIGTPGEELPRGLVIKQIRVAILLGSKLLDGMHMVRAAALTFATLLSIVPLLAVLFFVIQRLDLGEQVYSYVEGRVESIAERVAPEPSPLAETVSEAAATSTKTVDASPVPLVPHEEPVNSDEAVAEDSDSSRLQRDIVGALFQGGAELDFEFQSITREMVLVIQGLIILFSGALAHMFTPWLARGWMRRRAVG